MLKIQFDESHTIVILEPGAPLTTDDFDSARGIIDNHLALRGKVRGIIVRAREFPDWDSFQGFLRDFRFFRDYHQRVKNIALVTNSTIDELEKSFSESFPQASVRRFGFDETKHARGWILNDIDYE